MAAGFHNRNSPLRPWCQVAKRFNAMAGTRLSTQRVYQIGLQAEQKIKRALNHDRQR